MKYRTIVADPPWHYPERLGNGPNGTHHDFPYATLGISEIADLPVPDLADEDCVLWLWTTDRYLFDARRLLDKWSFRYVQTLVWVKSDPLPFGGSVAPQATEYLLVGKRGKPPCNRVLKTNVVITPNPGKVRGHSTKPEAFLDYIEGTSPAPYLELFARRNRLGWDTWGNESLEMVDL